MRAYTSTICVAVAVAVAVHTFYYTDDRYLNLICPFDVAGADYFDDDAHTECTDYESDDASSVVAHRMLPSGAEIEWCYDEDMKLVVVGLNSSIPLVCCVWVEVAVVVVLVVALNAVYFDL